MQGDDIFPIIDMQNLFIIESYGRKDADLFAVQINELILIRYGQFILNSLFKFL